MQHIVKIQLGKGTEGELFGANTLSVEVTVNYRLAGTLRYYGHPVNTDSSQIYV